MKIICTNDGSSSIFLPEINETYHSKFGAMTESLHVYIKNGLQCCQKTDMNILEIGFGTGLNACLSLLESISGNKKIYYESIEKYPLDKNIINQLEFFKDFNQDLFLQIHKATWDHETRLNNNFTLHKKKADLLDYQPDKSFDVIFFDAFAPDKQPEMWTDDIFSKIYAHTNPKGILVTYSAKGSVRRSMQKAGFIVERIQGPPGKREMLRALKPVK